MSENTLMKMSTQQLALQLKPVKQLEVDGIPMGVFNDGTPYLTARGLAKICGVAPSVIITLGSNWDEEKNKPRGQKISSMLYEQGFKRDGLFIETTEDGKPAYASEKMRTIMEKEIKQDNWFRTSYRIDSHGDVHCYFHLGKVEHGMSLAHAKELRNNLSELIDAVMKEGVTA